MRLRKSQTYRAESITLRRSDLGEADRILTLYTREHGKRRAVAKSVRRPQSRLAGHIELFTHAEVFLAVGTNLDVLTQATAIEVFPAIADDLARFARASWAAELVDRLTPEEEADLNFLRIFSKLYDFWPAIRGTSPCICVSLRSWPSKPSDTVPTWIPAWNAAGNWKNDPTYSRRRPGRYLSVVHPAQRRTEDIASGAQGDALDGSADDGSR